MAEARHDRPHGSAHFLVEIGRANARAAEAGFFEVLFPSFAIADAAAGKRAEDSSAPAGVDTSPTNDCLVLRRGATGALDLYMWWDAARRGEAPRRRVVTVKLLADDLRTVVLTWRFRNVRPVRLSYSPLRALDGGVLMETIELAFDGVEMA
jgi:T4-like virus tail tube protein gp19.